MSNISEVFIQRSLSPTKASYFLFGPRGTGKSTWVRRLYPDAIMIDLLDDAVRRDYLARPELLAERLEAESRSGVVIIDEIEKVPELLNTVHRLIESKKSWRFIMTGSSARKLRRGGVNLLGGRALWRNMHPFMACELGDEFRIEEAIHRGLLPVIRSSSNPDERLRSYVGLYLREEIEAEGFVRNIGSFARFLEAISFSHGGILNLNHVARECQVTRRAVQGYLEVLEDLHFAWRIDVFAHRAKRAPASHPKLYLFDAGVFRACRPTGSLDRPEEIAGAALEGLVAQHLRAWCDYRAKQHRLYYWRTRGGSEVDFVIYGEDGLFAMEVKNSTRVRPEDLRGLRAFREDYPQAKAALLYRGRDRLKRDGVLCIPCEDALRHLNPAHHFNSMLEK